jgi:hypothetical protein
MSKIKEKGKVIGHAQSSYENLSISIIDCCGRLAIFICQKLMPCNKLFMVMGGVS